eukprot:scaffold94893_cov110-Cyclotella_meneghiniana.AAC.1
MSTLPEESSSGSKTIPTWDGTPEKYALFKAQFKALVTMNKANKIFNETEMNGLLKETAYERLAAGDQTKLTDGEKKAMKLYEDNAKMAAIFTLGQKTSAGAMVIAQTVTDEY